MNIVFNIDYGTVFGEELVLNIITGRDRGTLSTVPYRMRTADGKTWTCSLNGERQEEESLDYYYSVVRGADNEVRSEWKVMPHRLELCRGKGFRMEVNDRWIDLPEDSYLYSSAFTDCIRRRRLAASPMPGRPMTLRLKVRAPQIGGTGRLVLVGNERPLGAWNALEGVSMQEHNYNEWVADIDASALTGRTFEFKFVMLDRSDPDDIMWEDGYNRRFTLPEPADNQAVVCELDEAFFPISDMRCAGTLVPLFSLRSRRSFGVGDFGDLKQMTDWVAKTNQRVLQLLPINDTTTTHTWTDSYPYSCISIFALHPQYADLNALPPLKDKRQRARFELLREELNGLRQIDYERVNAAKTEYLRLLYAQEGQALMSTDAFRRFFGEAQSWLVPYAQYCIMRERYGTADFTLWEGHTVFREEDRHNLSTPGEKDYEEAAFYYFVQFILSEQMADAHRHARSKGVILKGDIPIGVSRHGCDVWQEPRYFNLDGQAGAPPDDFSKNGQNWGFPTYNWPEMLRDGCRWWQRRFSNMARYFDAYRIDHVLGFFRIWEIPVNAVHGLLGQFSPSLGLTRKEIEAYGLNFQEELFTEPFITDWVLDRMFGGKAQMVRETYLEPSHDGRYRMRAEYDTQRKVEAAFAEKTAKEDLDLRDGLYALISDVLFVRDHRDPEKFHPRISVQFDYIYESLYDSDKYLFNKIYNDYFYRRNNQFWYREAMTKLPKLVDATRMLVCAEDLGMVPDCVAWVLKELKILSLELQSMPKDPHVRFGVLSSNPYRSVCTISSHDTPTLRQWWDEDRGRTQDYYNNVLQKYGDAPHPLPGWLARDIIARNLACPSMLCILSVQDWMAIDEGLRLPDADGERVNIPANPRHYWRYRMHVGIERLMECHDFNQNMTDLITESGRS